MKGADKAEEDKWKLGNTGSKRYKRSSITTENRDRNNEERLER